MLEENAKLLRSSKTLSTTTLGQPEAASLPNPAARKGPKSFGHSLTRRLVELRPTFISLLLGGFVWEAVGRLAHFRFLPPFSAVLMTAAEMAVNGQILVYLASSVTSLIAGYSAAVVIGVLLGTLMGRYKKIEYLFDPYLNAFLAAPKLVFVPVLYALFGVSRLVQVVFVFISALFDVVVNTMRGIQTVDPAYLEMARAFGAKEHQLFWKVLIPGAMPIMMAGLRLAMGRAVKGMVKGEMVISLFGLGALLRLYGSRFDSEKVFAILLVVVVVALICSSGVQMLERRVTQWMEPN